MVIALFDRLAPVKDAKMEIHSLTDLKTPPPSRRSSCGWDSDSRRSSTTDMLPHTPPQSTTGSPRVKTESESTRIPSGGHDGAFVAHASSHPQQT